MKAVMLSLGLPLLYLIHAEAQDTLIKEQEKLVGKWHIIAITSGCEWFQQKTLTMTAITISLMEDGELRISMSIPTYKYLPEEKEGKYSSFYSETCLGNSSFPGIYSIQGDRKDRDLVET